MPRIYDSESNPLDFCADCFPDEESAEIEYGQGEDGPDGRGNCYSWNAEHPDYEHEDYCCEECSKPLTCEDN